MQDDKNSINSLSQSPHANVIARSSENAVLQISCLQNKLDIERQVRFSETAALTKHVMAISQTYKDELESKQVAMAEIQQKLKQLQTEKDDLTAYLEEIFKSTSWRITSPMRKFKNLFIRNK